MEKQDSLASLKQEIADLKEVIDDIKYEIKHPYISYDEIRKKQESQECVGKIYAIMEILTKLLGVESIFVCEHGLVPSMDCELYTTVPLSSKQVWIKKKETKE